MNQSQKHNVFKVPEGYFEEFPDKVFRKRKNKVRQIWLGSVAAAAVLVLGMVFFVGDFAGHSPDYYGKIEEEMELWISAGYWNEEEMLLLAEYPNEILDFILEESWAYEEWSEEDLMFDAEIW
jgi:hypothetical protein